MFLAQTGDRVTGSYDAGVFAISGTVKGNVLSGKLSSVNPSLEWNFTVTLSPDGSSFDGTEYYGNPPKQIHGQREK